MTPLNIHFNTYGNDKQKQVAKYWIDKETTDIVYGGSKGCFSSGTMVNTIKGLKPIEQLNIGDIVLSLNESARILEYKKILQTFRYGGGHQNEVLIIFTLSNNTQIKCTYNHEFYLNGIWITAAELAKRVVDVCGEHEQQIPYIKSRSANDNRLQGEQAPFYNETSSKKERRLHVYFDNIHRPRTEANNTTPISSYGVFTEPGKPSNSQPQKFYYFRQQGREFGMDECKQKLPIFCRSRKDRGYFQKRTRSHKFLSRVKGVEFKINRGSSKRNQDKIQTENIYQENVSKRVWSSSNDNKGCYLKGLEAREINIFDIVNVEHVVECGYLYDISVEGNSNFCITDKNIIVHNSGKSYLGVSLIFGDAFLYPGTHYFIARVSLTNIRKFTIPTINEVFEHWGIPQANWKYNGQDNFYELHNGSKIFLLDASYMPSDPLYMRFGSMQMTRGMIEEAGEFSEEAKNNLAASIGRWKNDIYNLWPKLLQTCNPSKNYLYREYYRKHKEGKLEIWKKFVQALPQDNKRLPAGYLENLERILSKSQKARLLRGEWEYDDSPDILIIYEKILDCFTNKGVSRTGRRCITCDLARLGGDKIVKIEWEGFVGTVTWWDKSLLDVTGKRLQEDRIKMGIGLSDVLCDEGGLGGGVIDYEKFVGFVANHSAVPSPEASFNDKGKQEKENFDMIKSQCSFRMADRINKNGIYLICSEEIREMIIEEMEQVKQKDVDSDLKKGIIPKDKVKEMLGRSPDFWDAIMMREYFELKPNKVFSDAEY